MSARSTKVKFAPVDTSRNLAVKMGRRHTRPDHSKTTVIGVRVLKVVYEAVCKEAVKDARSIGAEAGILLAEAVKARKKKGGR